MKKFIIMGLTLSAFALVSCGKSDKEKCEEDEKKEWKDDKCVDKATKGENGDPKAEATYTINNTLATAAAVSSGEASVSLEQNKCASVKASQWAALKVDGVCDNSDTAADDADDAAKQAVKDNDCPEAGNYNIAAKADNSGNELAKADKAAENCAELKKAEAPAPAAPPANTGSSTGG